MQISNENGRLKGSYTPKDLAWMRGIEVPALAVAIAMKEADDSAEKFGETMRFAMEGYIYSQTTKGKMLWLYVVGELIEEGFDDWQIKVVLMIYECNKIIRFANSADKKAFREFMRIKGVPMREEIIAAWEHHCTEEAN